MTYTAEEIIPIYLSGQKVRRTLWYEGEWVQFTNEKSRGIEIEHNQYVQTEDNDVIDPMDLDVGSLVGRSLYNPLTSISRFGLDKSKLWETI